MECKNLMEELVDMRIDDLMGAIDMCRCPQCREDVKAYALNHLAPCYVTSNKGSVFSRFTAQTAQHQAEVASILVRAIEIVRKSPRHESAMQQV